jgi:DNA repair exonuclease SbcCD ATPase subunit
MSIKYKSITIRNFLSVGAVTQAVKLDTDTLTLVLGENLDLGGNGARNGVGKTTVIQALCYALYGNPINQIRKDNLINRTNGKNMLVTLEFNVNGIDYKIERGRKPNILKFYVNDDLQKVKDENNESQGENKETQSVIESIVGMTSDMFKHVVALNTYSEPFLSMRAGDQRNVIEQLLGITLLSEKADLVKEKIRANKEEIQQEEFKNKAVEEANKRVREQIDSLKRRQTLWFKQHDESLNKLTADYSELIKIDIETELLAHKELAKYNENVKKKEDYQATKARHDTWLRNQELNVQKLESAYDKLCHIDIEQELLAHEELKRYLSDKVKLEGIEKLITSLENTVKKETKLVEKLEAEVTTLEDNKCYACGQDFHDDNHAKVIADKKEMLDSTKADLAQTQIELEKNKNSLFTLGEKPSTFYNTESEAIKHGSEIESLVTQITQAKAEKNPFEDQLSELSEVDPGPMPITIYDTEREAIEHKNTISNIVSLIDAKINEKDPYNEQIDDMESKALQEISFERINELTKTGEHLKFLLDVLTNKDSFVRKKIIEQSISYLNSRLKHYLEKIGLPHSVLFKPDLSVEITELGRELDFDNLSRGEMNRLILSLSWSFRDVWESMYGSINVMFVDELIDSGMDGAGMENSLSILKDMTRNRQKSIWLVSHRDELSNRVNSVLKVTKENGFTSYENVNENDK